MAFEVTTDVDVGRDDEGYVRLLRHPREPFSADRAGVTAPSPRALADLYVREVAPLYGIDQDQLEDLSGSFMVEPSEEPTRLKAVDEKAILDTITVAYQQTLFGLPIWEAQLNVRVYGDPPSVASSYSTLHHDVAPEPPAPGLTEVFAADPAALAGALGAEADAARDLTISATRLLVYRYDPEQRLDPTTTTESVAEGQPLGGAPPVLPLPPVPDTVQTGRHYVVREFLFRLAVPNWGDLNWRAFVEPETGAVLYLRALVASATACIFLPDPITATGTPLNGCSPEANLNAARVNVSLLGLSAPGPGGVQALGGGFVALTDTDLPAVAPPTATTPFSFCYSAVTNEFAAANAYFHYDGVYRMVEGMGFTIAGPGGYFNGTTFPVPVDHQGFGTSVNAAAHGNAAGNGMGRYRNGLVQSGCPVGIATDVRVVLHEFGHALLWDHVNSPNFGFCHSAGDTLGVILHDPGSKAPDRFLTFPFVTAIGRRHDRDVAAGWAWGGTFDDRQYGSEQILSTLLFRVYRSTGGDDAGISIQRFAARYLAFLIVKAIGTLTVTTTNPAVFATALMDADESTTSFEGHPGGAWHKIIRWSFEQQGLYQPPGAPTPVTRPGAPPPVDVYINDGRNGAYFPYLPNFTNTTDIWNRRNPDGAASHEDPMIGVPNHVYVRVRNRGTQAANNAIVKVYQGNPAGGLQWPGGWQAVTTPQLPASGPIPPGGQTVVGPFSWTPRVSGKESLLASVSAPGDLSNADTVNGPIPNRRLVPFDNNIAQRDVAPTGGAVSITVAAGASAPGAGWVAYGTDGIYIDVDTSAAHFGSTPKYVSSIGGSSYHWVTTGGSAIYAPTPTRFRVYVRMSDGSALTPADAAARGWHINWIGIE